MRTDPDPAEEALLEAVLRDEVWLTHSATGKAHVVAAFCAHRRRRKLVRWASVALVLIALAGGVAHWFESSATHHRPRAEVPTRNLLPSSPARSLSDQELLAVFPQGSCFIAEVEGRKHLVFLDPDLDRMYVAHTKLAD